MENFISHYITRRRLLIDSLDEQSFVIFRSAQPSVRSRDVCYPFVQEKNLFYLTGIEEEGIVLILGKAGKAEMAKKTFTDRSRWGKAGKAVADESGGTTDMSGGERDDGSFEILFVVKSDEKNSLWHGSPLSIDEIQSVCGIEDVRYVDEWESRMDGEFDHRQVGVKKSGKEGIGGKGGHRLVGVKNDEKSGKNCHGLVEVDGADGDNRFELNGLRELSEDEKDVLMSALRVVKCAEEIVMIGKSLDVAFKVFDVVCALLKPGIFEYEVEAVLDYVMKKSACCHSFPPIIASGSHGCVLHYDKNDDICVDGDLLLLDFGVEYHGYTCDICRVLPVCGRFSPRQREVYVAVYGVLTYALSLLRPGLVWGEYKHLVGECMTGKLLGLGLLTHDDLVVQSKEKPAYKKYFPHSISHSLGLDVHDPAGLTDDVILKDGMVLTVEPGIYILEEGLGIRLEENVVIREDGCELLSRKIPVKIDDIEKLFCL